MIQVENIYYRYPESEENQYALRGVSFMIEQGERLAIMGSNGSGKTTLVRCLNGLLFPCQGEIKINGLLVNDSDEIFSIRQQVGMVFQNPDNQMVATTVERELAFGLENIGIPTHEMRIRIDEVLEQFDLIQYRQSAPHLLSGGERQRLALASVLIMKPRILILDEPTSLLDPRGRKDVFRLLNTHPWLENVTLIFVTQYPEEVLHFDRLFVMDQGQVKMDGSPDKIFLHSDALQSMGLTLPVSVQIQQYLKEAGLEY